MVKQCARTPAHAASAIAVSGDFATAGVVPAGTTGAAAWAGPVGQKTVAMRTRLAGIRFFMVMVFWSGRLRDRRICLGGTGRLHGRGWIGQRRQPERAP